jgi:ketosteroid isomerase-like protein
MAVTRRSLGHMAVAGAVAFGASIPLIKRKSFAKADDRMAVERAVTALRQAILARDVDKLRDLLVDELSYGLWPGGHIQKKYEFIAHIARKEPIYTSITISDPSITISGNNAIVRHREAIEAHTREKPYSLEFGVLQIWQKQHGQWRPLARQGWKPEIS